MFDVWDLARELRVLPPGSRRAPAGRGSRRRHGRPGSRAGPQSAPGPGAPQARFGFEAEPAPSAADGPAERSARTCPHRTRALSGTASARTHPSAAASRSHRLRDLARRRSSLRRRRRAPDAPAPRAQHDLPRRRRRRGEPASCGSTGPASTRPDDRLPRSRRCRRSVATPPRRPRTRRRPRRALARARPCARDAQAALCSVLRAPPVGAVRRRASHGEPASVARLMAGLRSAARRWARAGGLLPGRGSTR